REVHVRQVAELAVALEVLDDAPAVDVLEHDAQLAVDALEVEDAADVLVVEHGVAARLLDEQAQVLGLWRAQLLDHDRALEARLAQQHPLAHGAHAAGAQLVKETVLRLGQETFPGLEARARMARPGCQDKRPSLYWPRCASWLST